MKDGFDRPATGSANDRILSAARGYVGTSTRSGPGGGNVACAWSVNNILSRAGIQKVGANPNLVSSVESSLRSGRGTQVSPSQARPGDIVVAPNSHHIGIYMGNGRVMSNSSSRAAFQWNSGINFDGAFGGGQSRIYRVNP